MADYRAFMAVSTSIVELLRDNYDPAHFTADLEFAVFGRSDFEDGLTAGVSVYLYRATINGSLRTPPGRLTEEGGQAIPRLPVDLHLLLTAWSDEPSTEQAVAAWMMRTLEDYPVLPVGLLNRAVGEVFQPDEAVELASDDLPHEELLHLWELIGPDKYQLSFPYRARHVLLDSELTEAPGSPVQDRLSRYGTLTDGAVT